MGITDSVSCYSLGHPSENWTKNMLSTAETKFLSSSATSAMALQKLIPHATVTQLPINVCLWLPSGSRCFQRAIISKRGMHILIMKRPIVIHAALGITVTTVKFK